MKKKELRLLKKTHLDDALGDLRMVMSLMTMIFMSMLGKMLMLMSILVYII